MAKSGGGVPIGAGTPAAPPPPPADAASACIEILGTDVAAGLDGGDDACVDPCLASRFGAGVGAAKGTGGVLPVVTRVGIDVGESPPVFAVGNGFWVGMLVGPSGGDACGVHAAMINTKTTTHPAI